MNRRQLLALIAGSVALPGMARAVPEPPPRLISRRLSLVNPHTGETFSGTYRDDDGPIPQVMDELSVFLRDFHSGEKIPMDIAVLDFLAAVMSAVGQTQATILSGYRTVETNAMLSKTTFGVAENSQHIYGRALDVHFGDKLADAMKAARAMQRGGVGWYPHSSFMHIDSGPVRNWDLDHVGLGTLLVGHRHIHFNHKGEVLAANHGKSTVVGKPIATAKSAGGGKLLAAQNTPPQRARITRVREAAHAVLKVRKT